MATDKTEKTRCDFSMFTIENFVYGVWLCEMCDCMWVRLRARKIQKNETSKIDPTHTYATKLTPHSQRTERTHTTITTKFGLNLVNTLAAPGQQILQVCQHVLERPCPLGILIELQLDGHATNNLILDRIELLELGITRCSMFTEFLNTMQ